MCLPDVWIPSQQPQCGIMACHLSIFLTGNHQSLTRLFCPYQIRRTQHLCKIPIDTLIGQPSNLLQQGRDLRGNQKEMKQNLQLQFRCTQATSLTTSLECCRSRQSRLSIIRKICWDCPLDLHRSDQVFRMASSIRALLHAQQARNQCLCQWKR